MRYGEHSYYVVAHTTFSVWPQHPLEDYYYDAQQAYNAVIQFGAQMVQRASTDQGTLACGALTIHNSTTSTS